ncbi:MAG: glycosyltransferase family 92 protein [Chlamydiales bacterium]|nr:glycosyltransferase family 92 protein [Chlamydiales bacterium]
MLRIKGHFRAFLLLLTLAISLVFSGFSAARYNDTRKGRVIEGVNEAMCPYYLSICAVFQNEGPWLKEWLEFHRLVGVQHFYLYNNNSEDDYFEILLPYIDEGIVELIDWPTPWEENLTVIQEAVYNHCVKKSIGETLWLAVVDVDEFIIPIDKSDLCSLLRPYDKDSRIGGIMVFWQFYGTSWIHKLAPDKLLTESMVLKMPFDDVWNRQVKSICKPHKVARYCVHGAHYKPGYCDITTNGKGGPHQPVQINRLRINHYWTRDEDYFVNIKVPRRAKWEGRMMTPGEINTCLESMNRVEDRIMDRFVPALRQRVFGY